MAKKIQLKEILRRDQQQRVEKNEIRRSTIIQYTPEAARARRIQLVEESIDALKLSILLAQVS